MTKKNKKQPKRRKLSSDSEADDSIPPAAVQVDELQSKVQKIIAQRKVLQKDDKPFTVTAMGKNLVVRSGTSSGNLFNYFFLLIYLLFLLSCDVCVA